VQELLAPATVRSDEDWGLDHGTWSLLMHLFPKADVPVVQLSIDLRQPAAFHYELGQRLALLRDEGVLILGSGNVVHNLRAYNWSEPNAAAHPWAADFEGRVKEALLGGDAAALIDYKTRLGAGAAMAVPTPEHYLPLLYVLGTRREYEAIAFPVEGVEGGSISMLGVRVG
jgi:4,5-DOPA dioxygenase extradiol